jgi:hypothetical protein
MEVRKILGKGGLGHLASAKWPQAMPKVPPRPTLNGAVSKLLRMSSRQDRLD